MNDLVETKKRYLKVSGVLASDPLALVFSVHVGVLVLVSPVRVLKASASPCKPQVHPVLVLVILLTVNVLDFVIDRD